MRLHSARLAALKRRKHVLAVRVLLASALHPWARRFLYGAASGRRCLIPQCLRSTIQWHRHMHLGAWLPHPPQSHGTQLTRSTVSCSARVGIDTEEQFRIWLRRGLEETMDAWFSISAVPCCSSSLHSKRGVRAVTGNLGRRCRLCRCQRLSRSCRHWRGGALKELRA